MEGGQMNGEDRELFQRDGFDPYGQTLPAWLTYTTVTTTINGEEVITGYIQELPQTYYGPSIPLGSGWVYGGLSSTAAALESSVEATQPITTDPIPASPTAITPISPPTSVSSSPSPSNTSSSQSLSSISSPIPVSSPTSSNASPLSTTSPPSPSTSSPLNSDSDDSDLIPLLPALLIPLLFLLFLLLAALYLWRRYITYQPSTTAPQPPSYIPRFLIPLLYPRKGYVQPIAPKTPTRKVSQRGLTLGDVKSPDEKSALLTGFTPQHHRHSSSLSGIGSPGAPSPQPRIGVDGQGEKEADTTQEVKDDVTKAMGPGQSLLQRLGLGWAIFGSNEPRKPSGFILERGFRSTSYAPISQNTGHRPSSSMDGLPGTPSRARDVGSSDVKANESSGKDSSSGNFPSITDEQLFYNPPAHTSSSKATSLHTQSSRGIGPSGWIRTSTPQRIQPENERLIRSREDLDEGGARKSVHEAAEDGVSLAVLETPGTAVGDIDVGECGRRTRWSSNERIRFPIPPSGPNPRGLLFTPNTGEGGTFGNNTPQDSLLLGSLGEEPRRESYTSTGSENPSFHTATSDLSNQDPKTLLSLGAPMQRGEKGYKHASLSAFGSHPSTPKTSSHGHTCISEGKSSQDHSTDFLSPSSGSFPPTLPALNLPSPLPRLLSPFEGLTPNLPLINVEKANEGRVVDQGLFGSVPSSAGLSAEMSEVGKGGRGNRDVRRSYQGEPIFEMGSFGVATTPRTLGDFGEPIRPSPEVASHYTPLIVGGDRISETASVVSSKNARSTQSHGTQSSSSGGSSQNHMTRPIISDRALRGRRSQPQLFRASLLPIQPEASGSVIPPLPIGKIPKGRSLSNIKGTVSRDQVQAPKEIDRPEKGWFGRRGK